eukprot:2513413-Amphidinium_carterae.1
MEGEVHDRFMTFRSIVLEMHVAFSEGKAITRPRRVVSWLSVFLMFSLTNTLLFRCFKSIGQTDIRWFSQWSSGV